MKTLYDKILSKLPDTLEWSAKQDISAIKDFLLVKDELPRVFLESGGSLSAAHLAAQSSVEQGIVGVAMTPYQYIFSAWSKIPAKVVIISAGGRNVDAINAYRTAHSNASQKVAVMLMTSPSNLEKMIISGEINSKFNIQLEQAGNFG